MSRDWRLYWREIIEFCRRVEHYTAGMDRAAFEADQRTIDACLRNIELIGEAAKRLPPDARSLTSQVDWRGISGLRDILAHGYFAIDGDIIWNVVTKEVPHLRAAMETAGPV